MLTSTRCTVLKSASLVCGAIGNLFLLFNFTRTVRYIIALPASIILWSMATGHVSCLISITFMPYELVYLTTLLVGWNNHRYACLSESCSTGTNILAGLLECSPRGDPLFYPLHYLDDQYARLSFGPLPTALRSRK